MSKFLFKTPQEWFDALVQTSKEGKFPARSSGSLCFYLDKNTGNKCAVGIGIPDEDNVGLEGNVYNLNAELLPDFCSTNEAYYIQKIHDYHGRIRVGIDISFLPWNHDKFVEELLLCSVFKDVKYQK